MRDYLGSQELLGSHFQMEMWGRKVIRDTKVRREKKGMRACLVLRGSQGGQALWVRKANPLLVQWVLLVLLVSLDLQDLDGLDLKVRLALLGPQDHPLHTDQLSVSPALLVLLVHQALQDMQTLLPAIRQSTPSPKRHTMLLKVPWHMCLKGEASCTSEHAMVGTRSSSES